MHSSSLLPFLAAPAALALPTLIPQQDYASIHEAITGAGKLYFGTCSDEALLNVEENAKVIEYAFGTLTPENSMKWESLESTRGTYNWEGADFLVDWAAHHNQLVRGHTLVWHSQLPEWVSAITDPDELTEVIQKHVAAVMGRYKGDIYAWDVVNEIFNEDGTLRQSVFSDVLGDDFVRIAFEAARKADPDAKLYINDYNLDSASSAKTKAMVANINKWIAAGVPIDGIGSQTHITQGQGSSVPGALAALAASKVSEVAITELDISDAPAADYKQVVDACVQEKKCVGVSVWGVRDDDSWRKDSTPLLFDTDYKPKDAYTAVVDSLQ